MLQDLECYSSRAQGILKDMKYENYLHAKNAVKHYKGGPGNDLPTVLLQKAKMKFDKQIEVRFVKIIDKVKHFLATDDVMKAYKKNGVTYYSRKLLKDFHKFLKANLVASQVPNL
jgi:CMP-N-acetylneuraminic acid synthetase